MPRTIIHDIFENTRALSKKQRTFCDYCLKNLNSIQNLTVDQVAQEANIAKATIFRMLHQLEYQSFSDFKADLTAYHQEDSQPFYWQLQRMLLQDDGENALVSSIKANTYCLIELQKPSIQASFSVFVDEIIRASEIAVIGNRTSALLGSYLEALLLPSQISVVDLSQGSNFTLDRVAKLPTNSVILVIARWPHARNTLECARFAHKLGHKILLLTNRGGQLTPLAFETIMTPMVEEKYSVVPFVVILESLVEEIYRKAPEQSRENLDALNQVLHSMVANDEQ